MWLGGRIGSVTCRRILSTERACVQTQRNERSVRVPGLGLRQHVGAASGGVTELQGKEETRSGSCGSSVLSRGRQLQFC